MKVVQAVDGVESMLATEAGVAIRTQNAPQHGELRGAETPLTTDPDNEARLVVSGETLTGKEAHCVLTNRGWSHPLGG